MINAQVPRPVSLLKFAVDFVDRPAVIADLIEAGCLLYAAMFIAACVYCVIEAIRSPRSSPEVLERAEYRSCSWPTEGDAFGASSPLQSNAKPTLVNGQVTD